MSKIPASTFIQFGSNVNPASEVGVFGSYASPVFTGSVTAMMSSTQYQRGWFASVQNNNRQFIQDQNAIDIVFSNFLAYIQQMGIGEYVSTTVYDLNSIIQVSGQLYVSLVSPNTGNTPASSPTQWQSGIPGAEITGVVKAYAGIVAPSGYLLCDGSAVSRTTYAGLFNICSTNYGVGDGSTTFNLPDLRTRVPVGFFSGDSNFGIIGQVGGEESHILTIAELAPHVHVISPPAIVFGSGGAASASGGNVNLNGSTESAGGGSPHNNLQPYVTMNYIIKT